MRWHEIREKKLFRIVGGLQDGVSRCTGSVGNDGGWLLAGVRTRRLSYFFVAF